MAHLNQKEYSTAGIPAQAGIRSVGIAGIKDCCNFEPLWIPVCADMTKSQISESKSFCASTIYIPFRPYGNGGANIRLRRRKNAARPSEKHVPAIRNRLSDGLAASCVPNQSFKRNSAERAWAVRLSPCANTLAILPSFCAPCSETWIRLERFWKS